jgi:hypothetical protein
LESVSHEQQIGADQVATADSNAPELSGENSDNNKPTSGKLWYFLTGFVIATGALAIFWFAQ